jgi:hypothetical protein
MQAATAERQQGRTARALAVVQEQLDQTHPLLALWVALV